MPGERRSNHEPGTRRPDRQRRPLRGLLLYPYRPSVKNRQRWTFGGLYPGRTARPRTEPSPGPCRRNAWWRAAPTRRSRSRSGSSSSWPDGSASSPSHRTSGRPREPFPVRSSNRSGSAMRSSTPGRRRSSRRSIWANRAWRRWRLKPAGASLCWNPSAIDEPLRGPRRGCSSGPLSASDDASQGVVELGAAEVAAGTFRVTVRIENQTPFEDGTAASRDEALLHGLVSTHTILGVRDGEFVSLIDPPEPFASWPRRAATSAPGRCWSATTGDNDTMLSSPIILYDYPQIAPESPGDLFDATEIDEILTLRILTLTDDEKRAMAAVDERARRSWSAPNRSGRAAARAARDVPRAPARSREDRNHG